MAARYSGDKPLCSKPTVSLQSPHTSLGDETAEQGRGGSVPFRSAFAFRAPLGVTAVQLCTLQSVSAVLHRSVRDYDDRIPSQLDSSERAAQGHVKIQLYVIRYDSRYKNHRNQS